MSRKFQKSSSTHTLFKSKISGSVGAPSSLKATQTKFKFHEPFFSSLHGEINEENQYLSETQKWKEKKALNPPKRRSFHTSCIYDNYIYIFGGKDITEGKLCDIMRLNLLEEDNPTWESVIPNNDIQLEPLAIISSNKFFNCADFLFNFIFSLSFAERAKYALPRPSSINKAFVLTLFIFLSNNLFLSF